jgi:glycosyltransferase involved in cell wall biosynthesis
VFPSKFEGIGRVVVEAQAAGLPCIISDGIPEEVDLIHTLLSRISLSQPVSIWAKAVLEALDEAVLTDRFKAPQIIEQSPFNIKTSIKDLEVLYLG